MRHFGHVNMQKNQIQNAALELTQTFPSAPVVGQLAFVNKIVYICVQNDPPPAVWIPLTREITVYTHVQPVPAYEWIVNHNLNTVSINAQTYGPDNRMMIPDEIEIMSPNQVKFTFGSMIDGVATIVTGHLDGNTKPTYAYTYYQTESASTWTIDHNLGYNPIVRVFIGTSEVQPLTTQHPTVNQTIVTFSTPQVGFARFI